MRQYLFALSFGLILFSSLFVACNKDDDDNSGGGTARVEMRLTDGPADYDAVLLDIQSVEVTMNGASPVVLTPVHPGVYDILEFRNGLDTLLLRADLPPGTVGQIRLVLGSNNSVVIDGTSYPLTTPSGQTSGVKLNLNQTFVAGGSYVVWIDFDAAKSIHQTGNGTYMLKPVIRAYSALTDGRIKGYVLPAAALPAVYAISGVDTYAAIPSVVDGYYRISGLPAGSYQVWFDAAAPGFQDSIVSNVPVVYGTETDLGVVTLHP